MKRVAKEDTRNCIAYGASDHLTANVRNKST